MSDNKSDKQLQLKSELVRHLTTAESLKAQNAPSSEYKVWAIGNDIKVLDKMPAVEQERELKAAVNFWGEVLNK